MPTGLRSAAATVGEALRSNGVAVYAEDVVQPPPETPLVPGLRVTIRRAFPVSVVAPDVQLDARTRTGTVGGLLAEQGVTVGPLDRVEPVLEAPVPLFGTVRIVRVREEIEQSLSAIPFGTRLEARPGLAPGARVRLQEGAAGVLEQTYRVRYEDGVAVARDLSDETRRDPVDEVIGVGPAVTAAVAVRAPAAPGAPGAPAGSPVASAPPPAAGAGGEGATRALTMVATAYDPGPVSTGKAPGQPGYGVTASGMRAGYGVVAVDPRVIPLGTRVYVPGYGVAVAGDTGSAIKGYRIDLGFASYGEAVRYGRRTVTVYVLD
jgi:3D (Asp-Asp-Asp) domain-containing protein